MLSYWEVAVYILLRHVHKVHVFVNIRSRLVHKLGVKDISSDMAISPNGKKAQLVKTKYFHI